MLTVGIDGRALRPPRTGIGVYLDMLLPRLSLVRPQWRFIVYLDGPVQSLEWAHNSRIHWREWAMTPAVLWRNLWLARQLEKDAVQVFWSPLGVLPWKMRIPAAVTIHDLLWRDHPATLGWRDRITRATQMSHTIEHSQRIIAVSQFTADRLRHYYPSDQTKVHVVRPGPGRGHFTEWLKSNLVPSPYLLSLGGGEPRKNNQRLITAFNCSRLPLKNWHLVVVGQGSERLRQGPNVHVFDYVERNTLNTLTRAADALVFPSLYEGFGFPVMEAVINDKPFLLSDIPAFREFHFLDDRQFFNPHHLDQMVDVLNRCANPQFFSSVQYGPVPVSSWKQSAEGVADVLGQAANIEGASMGGKGMR